MVQKAEMTLEEMQALSPDEQSKLFKRLDEVRGIAKNTNYACQYGSGVKTLARTAKVTETVAKKLHEGYHKLNWSIAEIAKHTTVKTLSDKSKWQRNPISLYWYSLRSDKDRFSTLVQGSGAYILDLWLFHAEKLANKRGLDFTLLGQFHDELVIECPEDEKADYEKLIKDAIGKVNKQLKLNRELGCDVNFGSKYSDIH